MNVRAVDMCGIVYDPECWEAYLGGFAEYAPGYLRMFASRFCRIAGADPREFTRRLDADPAGAVRWLCAHPGWALDLDAYVQRLVTEGVAHQVIMGSMRPLRGGGVVNDRVAEFAARHPDVLQAWVNVDLVDPDAAIREVRRGVHELGMRGVSVTHFLDVADPLSAGAHAFYAEVERLGLPLWVHTGYNFSTRIPVDWCSWRQLDAIAREHQQLVIIAGHGGWPWVLETLALCQRHPNVHVEFSTHRARHMARPGSGWEALFGFGATAVRHKVLFGGVEWAQGLSTGRLAAEVADCGIAEPVRDAWLHDNAFRLLGLVEPAMVRA